MIQTKQVYQGEPDIVWRALGGDYGMTMTGVADTEAREGAVGDLARTSLAGGRIRMRPKWVVRFQVDMDVAPAAGTVVELWWCPSPDGVTFSAGITGVDADWEGSTNGSVAQSKLQLIHIGSIILGPDDESEVLGSTQVGTFIFEPPTRWGVPVLVNLGGQALEGDDNVHRITFTPIIEEVA